MIKSVMKKQHENEEWEEASKTLLHQEEKEAGEQ